MVATHPYQGEDEDELSFEKGTIIAVVPYDDPEDEVNDLIKFPDHLLVIRMKVPELMTLL